MMPIAHAAAVALVQVNSSSYVDSATGVLAFSLPVTSGDGIVVGASLITLGATVTFQRNSVTYI